MEESALENFQMLWLHSVIAYHSLSSNCSTEPSMIEHLTGVAVLDLEGA